ncbi:cupin domain-containing protein [Microvirga sp. G4-2]|uniref:cupin domain-containing protein n=1 Tax=Microvirga sp. G4-2 TaxID=3434467 RepID=UPI004044AC17
MKSIVVACAFVCVAAAAQAQQPAPQSPGPNFILKQIAPTLPTKEQLEVRVRTSTIQPGAVGQWHTHPTPPIVYVMEGTLSVERKDGETVHTQAGQAVIEPVNTIIRATNKGQTPVKLVIFQVSPPDVPESQPAPSQ